MSTEGTAIDNSPLADKETIIKPSVSVTLPDKSDDDDEQEPPQISSEQLLRRASFKKILEDLSSSADAINKSEALTSTAPSASILQQTPGLTNPALLPLLQNLQQSALAAAVANHTPPANDLTQQLAAAMMLPNQLSTQQQLTAALLNSQTSQSPLVANVASMAGNGLQIPSNLLSSALLNASNQNPLTNFGAQLAAVSGNNSPLNVAKSPLRNVSSSESVGGALVEEGGKKREIRLMKNREAARECRRKKKEYIRCLENRVAVLESQNQALIGELRALKELYLPKSQE